MTTKHTISKSYIPTAHGHLCMRSCGADVDVVMLQILPFGCAMLEPLMQALAVQGRGSVAIDLMGYGGSDARANDWKVEDFAANIVEGLDHVGVHANLLLAGHFTALIATEIAARFSDRVDRLAFDGVPAWTDEERADRVASSTTPVALDDDALALIARWKTTLAVLRKADPDYANLEVGHKAYLEAYRQFLRVDSDPRPGDAFFSYPTQDRLSSIAKPTLVIGSPTDTLRPVHERAVEWIPGACAHLFDITNPLYRITQPGSPEGLDDYARLLDKFATA